MSLVPVYQYHADKPFLRFFYTTLAKLDGKSWNSPAHDDCKNWSSDGIAFYGCDANSSNAVAIYQCYADVNADASDQSKYFFSINPSQAGEGWYQSSQTPAFYAYGGQDAGLLEITMWYVAQPQYNYFLGNASQTGAFLPPRGWLPMGWDVGENEGAQPFYALPGQAKLAYAYQNLNIDSVSLPTGTPSAMFTEIIDNPSSSSSVSQQVSKSVNIAASVSLSLTETIGGSQSVKAEGGIPFIAEGEATTTISYSLSSTQAVSVTDSQTLTVSATVTVPPGGSVVVTGTMYIANSTTVPYALECLVTAAVAHQTIGAASTGPCAALIDFFMQEQPNFKGLITPAPSLNGITISLAGVMKGTWGVSADVSVDDNPVDAARKGAGKATVSGVNYKVKAGSGE